MRAEAKSALEAFAEPIRDHARAWASVVLTSIVRDIEAGVSRNVAVEVAGVVADDELDTSGAMVELQVPEGARAWGADEWRAAFVRELERLAVAHREQTRGRGEALVREHLRNMEAHR